VIETGQFMRVGGVKPIEVDVRIVAATNQDLNQAISTGAFRADLYYRLNVVTLHLPPLRERRHDLALLIKHFTQAKAAELGVKERAFLPEAIDHLLRYRWPGNVRELENLIERLLVLSDFGPVRAEELPEVVRQSPTSAAGGNIRGEVLLGIRTLSDAVDEFERQIIVEALHQSEFNQTRTAERLGTTRRILKYRIDKLGILEK